MRPGEWWKKPFFWLASSVILVWLVVFQLPDGRLHLAFCQVGEGDAILVSYRLVQLLIDGGPDERVLTCLSQNMPFWDREVEVVVLTHPQLDHFGGLIEVIKRYRVKRFVINSATNNTASFAFFRQLVEKEKAPVVSLKAGEGLRIGPLVLKALWPPSWEKSWGEDLNRLASVFQLSFGDFDVLLTSDIDYDIERMIDFQPVEVLKVAHHGSRTSTSTEFLKKVKPKLAIISVGKNRFGHPSQEVITRLYQQGVRVLRTDQRGTIRLASDGKSWQIR